MRVSKRLLVAGVGVVLVAATFIFLLPRIADYRDVWDVVQTLSWGWILALLAATVVNIVTFAPPWLAVLPGLRFWPALAMTQASTALSLLVPAGAAVGIATAYGMLRGWGFGSQSRRAVGDAGEPLESARQPDLSRSSASSC